jgi:hypothetical protein
MEYLINGTVTILLFVFFTILSVEAKMLNVSPSRLTGMIGNFRLYWKQVIKK